MARPLGPKNPSASFYWNDWDNDEALKACSLAAQGLWMRMLCIAARSPEPGIVMIGEFPASRAEIAPRIAALVGQPLETVNALIDELLTSGAASLDRKKRIYNRRMVRAVALHNKRSEAGRHGAAVTNGKNKRKESLPQQNAGKPPANDPALHTSRLHPSDIPIEPTTESLEEEASSAAARDVDAAFAEWTQVAYALKIPDPGFLNGERRKLLGACLAEYGLERWMLAMANLRNAEWLRDDRDPSRPKHWVNLPSIIKSETFMGLLENRYAERHTSRDRRTTESLVGDSSTSAGIAAAFARRSVQPG